MDAKRTSFIGKSVRTWLGLAVLAVGGLALFAVACGGGGGGDRGDNEDASAVEAAVRAAADALNEGDVEAFAALWTDKGLQEVFGETRAAFPEAVGYYVRGHQWALGEVSNTQVSGDTATTEAVLFLGAAGFPKRFSLTKEGGAWKIDGGEATTAGIPDGTTAVDLTQTEYKFTFDKSAITSGNIAFNVSNIGREQHEVRLVKAPEDLDIEENLQSGQEPEGLQEIGFVEPLDPGEETTLLFTEPLGPGRYVMVCLVSAADGERHALKGMVDEFTVN